MPTNAAFYVALVLCALGWVFIGLGVVLFPLSLYFLMYSSNRPPFFALIVILGVVGFTLSLYVDSQFIAKKIF